MIDQSFPPNGSHNVTVHEVQRMYGIPRAEAYELMSSLNAQKTGPFAMRLSRATWDAYVSQRACRQVAR